jgi:hypothetical protein
VPQLQFVIMVLFMTPNYVTITIANFHTISMWYIIQKKKKPSHSGKRIFQYIWYSEICDISAFYFGADFPFNIGLYDHFHYSWVTIQPVMDIFQNKKQKYHIFLNIRYIGIFFKKKIKNFTNITTYYLSLNL